MEETNKKTLVIGASGATGMELVSQLIFMGQNVKIIIRPLAQVPLSWVSNKSVSVIKANISEISINEMTDYMKDCQYVVSCLGHNLTLSGIFGKPRRLVTNAVELVCNAIENNSLCSNYKFVLMNTTGNRNKDLKETYSLCEKIVMRLIRLLIPPQSDNENAADFLRLKIGQNHANIQWVAVRPDTLINASTISEYEVHPSPTRSTVFNAGKTSRVNVGHFMARLIVENDLWDKWKGKMPVIYNK